MTTHAHYYATSTCRTCGDPTEERQRVFCRACLPKRYRLRVNKNPSQQRPQSDADIERIIAEADRRFFNFGEGWGR